jgi:RNA polymerase sigma-70 factor (ECF subfamily)
VSCRLDRELRVKEPVSDIVQSAIREILTNPGRFTYQGPEAFRAFLIPAVEHKIAKKRRHWQTLKRGGTIEPISDLDGAAAVNRRTATPSEIAATREDLRALLAAVEELSEDDRKLLAMRRGAGLSAKAIAAELGMSERTVQKRLARIMTFLARRLGHGGEGGVGVDGPEA